MRTHLVTLTVLLPLLLVLPPSSGFGQESAYAGRVGFSASIQGSQGDILVPVWITDSFSLAPSLGLVWAQDSGTDVRFAIVPRVYFRKDRIAPFIGGRIGVLVSSPSVGSSTTDWVVGLAAGGEYFLDDHFSLGVESQLNLSISDENSNRFGNPDGTTLNTAAAVYATFYF
ncbi:MAG TPA: hypothetical protein VMF59_05185 [Bacteroidota bacterium]|nr:hypothetical protein [Bacteroidota bacterium]